MGVRREEGGHAVVVGCERDLYHTQLQQHTGPHRPFCLERAMVCVCVCVWGVNTGTRSWTSVVFCGFVSLLDWLASQSTCVLEYSRAKKLSKLFPQSRLLKQLTRAYHAHALGANGQAASGGVDREGRVRARSSSPLAACAPCLGTRLSGSRAGSDSLWRTGVVRRQITQAELATARSPQRVREQLLSTDSSNRLLIRPRCSNRPSGKLGARTW